MNGQGRPLHLEIDALPVRQREAEGGQHARDLASTVSGRGAVVGPVLPHDVADCGVTESAGNVLAAPARYDRAGVCGTDAIEEMRGRGPHVRVITIGIGPWACFGIRMMV